MELFRVQGRNPKPTKTAVTSPTGTDATRTPRPLTKREHTHTHTTKNAKVTICDLSMPLSWAGPEPSLKPLLLRAA